MIELELIPTSLYLFTMLNEADDTAACVCFCASLPMSSAWLIPRATRTLSSAVNDYDWCFKPTCYPIKKIST